MNKIILIDGSTGSPQASQIILIDKEAGWTSFDVVAKVRNALNKQLTISNKQANSKQPIANSPRLRVGHAGTLDPFATGLLIVLVGDATKKQAEFMKLDKEYEATLRLGYTSTTGDPEGTIQKTVTSYQTPTKDKLEDVLKNFIGRQKQIPPKHSAIKVNGKRAYEMARKGDQFELKPRTINIYQLTITKYHFPELHLKIKCSSGTYIRTLAEDIGKELDAGAYLTALRRTKIGKYDVKNAKNITGAINSILPP